MSYESSTSALADAQALQSNQDLTVGGLTLTSWQIVIWVLAGAVFCGILIALVAAYFNCK